MTTPATLDPGQRLQLPQTAADVKEHIQLIQRVMAETMLKDTHYGVIPGTQRPTLYKAGANLLLTTFRIAVMPEIDDLSTHDEIRYRVLAKGVHMSTGNVIGVGIGECSTSEEKYRWRDAVCQEEFDETTEARRRVKYARGRERSHYTRQQVRTVPADLANTVLKMAKKRAEVDLCLTGLACSDVFAQDLEDAPHVTTPPASDEPPPPGKSGTQAPRRKAAPADPMPEPQPPLDESQVATQHQVGTIMAAANRAGVPDRELFKQLNITAWEQMKVGQLNQALDWLRKVAP